MALDHSRMFVGSDGRSPHRVAGALLHALDHAFLRAGVRAARRHGGVSARSAARLDRAPCRAICSRAASGSRSSRSPSCALVWMLLHRAADSRAAGDLGDRRVDGRAGGARLAAALPRSRRSPSRSSPATTCSTPSTPPTSARFRWLWLLLHEHGRLEPFPGARWFVIYPLVPWVAVMAAGYVLGPWALLPRAERRARFLRAGLALDRRLRRAARDQPLRRSARHGRPTAARCARCSRSSTARSIRPRCSSWR